MSSAYDSKLKNAHSELKTQNPKLRVLSETA
jgi:hypothetical protein